MPIKSKYGAKRCRFNDISFPSMLERDCYIALLAAQKDGKIDYILRQVGFDLPAGYRHFVDFGVVINGKIFYLESKGRDLAMGKMRRLQASAINNITIHVIKKPAEIIPLLDKIL